VAARVCMLLSAGVVLMLGIIHLAHTFSGTKLTPRDPALQVSMSLTSPVITKETTMWRCWVGFNATHSMALILFGLVFGYLALAQARLLFASWFLLATGMATLIALVVLCRMYFFTAPLLGVGIAWIFYVISVALAIGPAGRSV
jgi:hypothetical protein